MNSKEIIHQLMLDQETIKTLEEKGDNPILKHRVEHHFTCVRIEPLMELVQVCMALGFLESPIDKMRDDPNDHYYFTDLISETRIDYPINGRESVLMGALAEAFGCEYDGWGTEVEK